MGKKLWKIQEIKLLIQLYQEFLPISKIAERLNRSVPTVTMQIYKQRKQGKLNCRQKELSNNLKQKLLTDLEEMSVAEFAKKNNCSKAWVYKQINVLKIPRIYQGSWTHEELQFLIEAHHNHVPLEEIAVKLSRSYNSVCNRVAILGLTQADNRYARWQPEQDHELLNAKNYKEISEIAQKHNRTLNSALTRIKYLTSKINEADR